MFFKTGVIRNFTLFTGKHLYFNLIPKETSTQVFPVKIAIFYKQLFCRTPLVAAFVSLIR